MNTTDTRLFDSFIEVDILDENNFLKIKETLTRIGYSSNKNKTLTQSCHIYHKRGKYYITHFKEMFLVDGQYSSMDENDYARRNTIANLLEEWKLLEILNPEVCEEPKASISQIKIIPFAEKSKWTLIQKYAIGKNIKSSE